MELPCRASGDVLLKSGELTDIRARLRQVAVKADLTSVIVCAFDHRTRMLPFIYADMKMVPAGVRSLGAAMVEAGFEKTRIVLQQWNKNYRPSQMKIDGRVPDIFMVSSMAIHSAPFEELIRDACKIDPQHRPLIIVGGPKIIYEPWAAFNAQPDDPWGADVAITGEEYVILNLLEALLGMRRGDEHIRQTFMRSRDAGELDGIPGLVYAKGYHDGLPEELVDTGIQRLNGNLDELPNVTLGYRLLERPSSKATLGSTAVSAEDVHKYCRVGGIVLTLGCKFNCPYCPIPAYNQRQIRYKTGERIADEMEQLYRQFGMRYLFGADDNFFNNKARTLEIIEKLAASSIDGKPFNKIFRWGTEVTVHDTLAMKDHLKTVRKSGIRALWLGVEDMTATLINKGQSVSKTIEAFEMINAVGISPMPMMMHHDSQPLFTPGKPYGLINQVRILRKAGAVGLQVLMITPATGSKLYEDTFTSGMVYESVGNRKVMPYMMDGNYVIASDHKQPWRKQFNILLAYLYFYNPLRFLYAIFWPKSKLYLADSGMQIIGMWGLSLTIKNTLGWAFRLMFCKIKRRTAPPAGTLPMRSPDGGPASHALPQTPHSEGMAACSAAQD